MGLKDEIRPLLPPTSRAFLDRTDSLSEALNQQSVKTEKIEHELRQIRQNQTSFLSVLGDLRYINLEYFIKLAQSASDILVAGWYGAENFGDELMLQTLLQCFPEDSLDRISVLLWDNFYYPTDLLDPRVTILHYPKSTWDLDQLVDHFSTLVWGGGAIIDDDQYDSDPNNTNTGNLFIRLSKKMIARGKRVYCLGLSTNDSISDRAYLRELGPIVQNSIAFSLRDPYSKKVLESSGINGDAIQVCEDLAFANAQLAKLPLHTVRRNDAPLRIALVPLSVPNLLGHYRTVIELLLGVLPEISDNYEFHLVPFLNDRGGHDARYCAELIDGIPDEHLVVDPYQGTLEGLHFEKNDFLISYKYHAALISLIQGVNTLCVCAENHLHYMNKMTHLVQLLSNPRHLASLSEFERDVRGTVLTLISDQPAPKTHAQFLENQRSLLKSLCTDIVK